MTSQQCSTPHMQSDRREEHNSPAVNKSRCDVPTTSQTSDASFAPLVPPTTVLENKRLLEASSSSPVLDNHQAANSFISLKKWRLKRLMDNESRQYYYIEDGIAHCTFCRVAFSTLMTEDEAITDHELWSHNCTLVLKYSNSRNVFSDGNVSTSPVDNVPITSAKIGGFNKYAKHPKFASRVVRRESFQNFPTMMGPTAHKMAYAGFFYVGYGNRTECYYCGGIIDNWKDGDVPWEQHVLRFKECKFLQKTQCQYSRKEIVREDESGILICKICTVRKLDSCFIPCGHMVACFKCAMSMNTCPICRKQDSSFQKVYIS